MTSDQDPNHRDKGAASPEQVDGALAHLLNRPLTEADLHEQTQRVGHAPEQERQRGASLLVFSIGVEHLALPAADIARVTRAVPAHRIPHRSNEVIRGLCNIDGELMLCASLASLLDIEPTVITGSDQDGERDAQEMGWMIILGERQAHWAVAVDGVHGLESADPDQLQSPPLTVERALVRYTMSVLPMGDKHTAILDTKRVCSGFQAALA